MVSVWKTAADSASTDKASDGHRDKISADVAARVFGHIQVCEIQLEVGSYPELPDLTTACTYPDWVREILELTTVKIAESFEDVWPESREAMRPTVDTAAKS